jgi:hypothetical protein
MNPMKTKTGTEEAATKRWASQSECHESQAPGGIDSTQHEASLFSPADSTQSSAAHFKNSLRAKLTAFSQTKTFIILVILLWSFLFAWLFPM